MLRGILVSRTRVLRLMRENALLSPHRRPQGKSAQHDGTITTGRPNEMWGTDGVRIETVDDGWVWVFSAVDHCDACCVGIHAVKPGNRFAALQPIAQGLLGELGGTGADVGRGLTLRMDSNNVSTSFSSARPATEVVRPPEGLVPRSVPDGLTHALIDLPVVFPLTRRPAGNTERRGFTSPLHVTQEGPDAPSLYCPVQVSGPGEIALIHCQALALRSPRREREQKAQVQHLSPLFVSDAAVSHLEPFARVLAETLESSIRTTEMPQVLVFPIVLRTLAPENDSGKRAAAPDFHMPSLFHFSSSSPYLPSSPFLGQSLAYSVNAGIG